MSQADFFEAVRAGSVETVVAFLERDRSLVNRRDEEGATALHRAALAGHREVVRRLIEYGAEVNARDDRFGATPAGWAIEYLREQGGALATEIDDLVHAIQRKDADWVERFLGRWPHLRSEVDAKGTRLADHAKRCGDERIASLFSGDGTTR